MLRFAVYDEHGPATQWTLVNAHMLGADDQPVRGDVKFENGRILCRKRGSGAAALCLQFDAGPMGRLMLQTCLLPDRSEPYLLLAELARHRIKMFIAKSEEWQMFDLSAEHPATRLWEEARRLLTEAWTSADPLRANRAANQALIYAIDATERLALAHAEILLHRRFGQKAASSSTLGVRIWPGRDGQALRDLVGKEFDLLVVPLNWRELETKEGTYNWEPVDRWMDWASRQGKPILAGPLLDFSKRAVPEWMYVWQHDYDTTRDLVYDHVERVVQRYNAIDKMMWNVGAGLNVNENFKFSAEQMLDLVRMSVLLVRQSRKGARVLLELSQPFGEHCAFNRESVHPVSFVERLVQEGVRLDAVGVQLLFGKRGGKSTRDLMQISAMLDRFFLLEIPIVVSAMGVPSEAVDAEGGWWHEPWSPELQSQWASKAFAIALSKPFIETLFWTDLFDHALEDLPGGGLISDAGRPKPSLQKLVSLRRHLRKPLGPLKLPSKDAGENAEVSMSNEVTGQ